MKGLGLGLKFNPQTQRSPSPTPSLLLTLSQQKHTQTKNTHARSKFYPPKHKTHYMTNLSSNTEIDPTPKILNKLSPKICYPHGKPAF